MFLERLNRHALITNVLVHCFVFQRVHGFLPNKAAHFFFEFGVGYIVPIGADRIHKELLALGKQHGKRIHHMAQQVVVVQPVMGNLFVKLEPHALGLDFNVIGFAG